MKVCIFRNENPVSSQLHYCKAIPPEGQKQQIRHHAIVELGQPGAFHPMVKKTVLILGALVFLSGGVVPKSGGYVTEIGAHALTIDFQWITPRQAHVTAWMTMPVSQECAWSVLTDYNRLAEFIPLLERSKISGRREGALYLDQRAAVKFPFYKKTFRVVFRVSEKPQRALNFEAVEGDFRVYKGSWLLQECPGGTHVRYEAFVEPALEIPRWVMTQLERGIIKASFRAILKQAVKKDADAGRL
ncbi:MAG: SRPBCC family protein [Candidatus Omnitrophica bacterium]|nr:SRPBCC family protein [Candidatus Omnitrophota bacterium]